MKQVLAWVCGGLLEWLPLLPSPGVVRVPAVGCSVSVCFVLTLVFSLPASTPLSYCLARWPLRYFSTCLSWCQCMLDAGACCCGLPFPDVLHENGKKNSLSPRGFPPAFSELGDCLTVLESMQRWFPVLCCAVRLEKTLPTRGSGRRLN